MSIHTKEYNEYKGIELPTKKTFKGNREEWLQKSLKELKPIFENAGLNTDNFSDVRISCGPIRRSHAVGICHSRNNSDGKKIEILILQTVANSLMALDILIHEVVHAVDGINGCEHHHNNVFKKMARKVGLVVTERGKGHTSLGDDLKEKCMNIISKLGLYPHFSYSTGSTNNKKQSTRMIKFECGKCGIVARASKTALIKMFASLRTQGPAVNKFLDELGDRDIEHTEDSIPCPSCAIKGMKGKINNPLKINTMPNGDIE
tara:strand:- start:452 stop:1234 length:783 start_codon:yes stop_codon:yes gene_type:complete